MNRWMRRLSLILPLSLLVSVCPSAVYASDSGETRCGATGSVERYECIGSRCSWQSTYQRCANTNKAPACNTGDTKCGSDGKIMRCQIMGSETAWWPTPERCAADRDPADNAPAGYGYGARPYGSPSYGGEYSSGGASGNSPPACSPGQRERTNTGQIRSCVMQNGRPSWEVESGNGMRN